MNTQWTFALVLLAGGLLSWPSHAGQAGLVALSDDEMTEATGGAEASNMTVASNQAAVSGNQIGGIGTTGAATGNGLTNNSGLTTLIANTGNQVVISQSTVVNVFLH